MNKHILRAIPASILLFSAPTWAAGNQSSVSTTLATKSRFEIVQSELAAKITLRVDKVCGVVSQMVTTDEGGNLWQYIPMENKPACTSDGRIRFQLFTSGMAARYTYLMNTDTGATWLLVTSSQDNLFWQKLP